ncbi:MAG TPA: DUF998 domain-containing protein [Egibacteraceae bacterium]
MTAVTTRPPATRTAPRALGCGIAAPAVLVVVDLVHALARPGYDPLRHWVSHLALGSFGWVGTATLLATALLLGGYALGLRRACRALGAPRGYPLAVAVSALALLVAAVFPMDPSLGFPPGAVPQATAAGAVHDVAGPVFVLASAVAALLSRRVLAALGAPPTLRLGAPVVAALVAVAFVACAVLAGMAQSGVWPAAPSGLLERVAIATGLGWGGVVAWRARRP